MISIIVPAHDEAAVIGRCLAHFQEGLGSGEAEVIVVCNGCRDRTAEVAGGFAGVRVVETDVPSKSNALNLGDGAASGFPRFYVDADVEMDFGAVRRVAAVLGEGPVLAASPEMQVDLDGASWAVRAFYRVWTALSYVKDGTIGAGVYALSEQGRRRFDRFPPVTADDGFVRLQFEPEERATVRGCRFVIRSPKSLAGVVRIKTRSHFGNLELRQRFPGIFGKEHVRHGRDFLRLAADPRNWPAMLVYAYVRARVRVHSHWKLRFGDSSRWERDESSRA